MRNGTIELTQLGKAYRRYPNRWDRLLEWVNPEKVRHESNWVLRDLNLEVKPGQAVGIIGRNGAGKSTLLKLITGTSTPTEGEVRLHGKIAALLELGMGFHPDFTGRQNAWMAAQLAGMSGDEITSAMPNIEAFAEIGAYIDEPIRTYSSGMQVRLAFSVATAIRPDILIVDEALAVGDVYFQHKCFGRIRKFRKEGTTLLFVSHDPGAIKSLCDRAILLDRGQVIADDAPDQILDLYNALIAEQENRAFEINTAPAGKPSIGVRSGDGRAKLLEIGFWNHEGRPTRVFTVGERCELRTRLVINNEIPDLTIGFLLRDRLGNDVFGTNTWHMGMDKILSDAPVGSVLEVTWLFPELNLGKGSYTVSVALHGNMTHVENSYDWWDKAALLEVVSGQEPIFDGVCFLHGVTAKLSSIKPSIEAVVE